jgi:hypothetical protein
MKKAESTETHIFMFFQNVQVINLTGLNFFLFFFSWQKKKQKSQGKKNAPPFFRANAQRY